MLLIYLTMILMSIIIILYLINIYISMTKKMNREKITPFECGFNQNSNIRLPFSTQFFFITLLFLIFDIEIILILPSIFLIKYFNCMYLYISLIMFILILLLSLIYEWMYMYLNWIT